MRFSGRRVGLFLALPLATSLCAQQAIHSPADDPKPTTATEAPNRDTSYIDDQGTAHVTRVVPVPQNLSPEAQLWVSRAAPDQGASPPLEASRKMWDDIQAGAREPLSKRYPNTIVEETIAGVPVRIVTPEVLPESNKDKVLLNLHGGGFTADSGSYLETIPIASYSKIKVVAVLHRLAPEHPFPAALDDSVAVYKELLKTYKPNHIVIYGTSAGAVLTAEVAAKLKQLGLPMPAALGIFSGGGDFDGARAGDSFAMYSLSGLAGHLDPPKRGTWNPYYTGSTDVKDPVLSPIYGDLHGLPPTLFVTSERDALLSSTVNLHRAYLLAGVDARLIVYDALPHGFWCDLRVPEAREANQLMADFFVKELAR